MFASSQKEKGCLVWLICFFKANSIRLSWIYKFFNADDAMWKTLFSFWTERVGGCRYVYSTIVILNTCMKELCK